MHLRRAILLFALVLGLTAVAAAVSPSRQGSGRLAAPDPAPQVAGPLYRSVAFPWRPTSGPPVRYARAGERVIVSVEAQEGGLVTIPLLGRTEAVSPQAPARFDLLAPAPGRFEVMFTAASRGGAERVGTLVTRP